MNVVWLGWLIGLAAAAAPAGSGDDFGWTESLADPAHWVRRPAWLDNPSAGASMAADGPVACFRVDEPGRGMKWSAPLPAISPAEMPYLVVRYRAEHVDTARSDYFVYLDDRRPGRQLAALRLCDMAADGRWHTAAVDLAALTDAEAISTAAIQVQAGKQGKARVWLAWLSFTDAPPDEAEYVGRRSAAPSRPDWIVPLSGARWTARPSWLGNPAQPGGHSVGPAGQDSLFRVASPGCGMKWSCDLAAPISPPGHHYLSMRYRARGCAPNSDYALCLLGSPRGKGLGYSAAVPPAALVSDGRWHNVEVDLPRLAAEFSTIRGLAIQVQADAPGATLEVADIRGTDHRRPARLADALDWSPGARFDGFQPIALGPAAQADSRRWRRHLRLADWPSGPAVTVEGVPFALSGGGKGPDLAATSMYGQSELRFRAGVTAQEVYLLVLAAFRGNEEAACGDGRLTALADVDRFLLRLEYADGTIDQCLPLSASTKRFGVAEGAQVLVAAADGSRQLEAVVLCDRCKQAAFAVAGITARSGAPLFAEALEDTPPLRVKPAIRSNSPAGGESSDSPLSGLNGLPVLERLVDRTSGWNLLTAPSPLVKLEVEGQPIAVGDLRPIPAETAGPADFRWYQAGAIDGLRVGIRVRVEQGQRLLLAARVENHGGAKLRVRLVAPWIGPYRLSARPEDTYYLWPKCGAAFDNRPCSYRERYCGLFPLQFVDTFSPADARGLTLRTLDTDCLWKHYLLEKKGGELTTGVEYSAMLGPGESLRAAPAVISLTDGDWHRGLEAYRRWLAGWHRPASPRKRWFREVFNFRQRFLWGTDPLYDAGQGVLRLTRAVEEGRSEFGGIDYLHLFDWGYCGPYGRIYGRTGDYSPYDYLRGGRPALHQAIAEVQAQGVPVGLYIEGYLLEERGRLGRQSGKAWQIRGADGTALYWPECSEMYACSFAPQWRQVQASTYAAKVRELGVDGMYLDEYGFAGSNVDCYAAGHGHAVPGYAVLGERDCTALVRRRIDQAKPGVALYSEETPVDVTTQFQDGSFTYNMSHARHTQTRVPLNLTRFAIPDFKTIEILVCDHPTASWATGVKWVFFNGEAIWLEGTAAEWFEPQTREAIRACYRILHKHRDAMTTAAPVPLVPTEQGGVFCNAFPIPGKTVYTLYNARHRTVRGELLRLPHTPGERYYDQWHGRPAPVRIEGSHTLVNLELGPQDVGCLVVSRCAPGSASAQEE
jgi:hypothetical protein